MVAFARSHPVRTYYVLAFAISWGAIFLMVGPGGFLTTTSTSQSFVLVGFASLLGPSLAGILMTSLVGGRAGWRDLLSRLRRWRVGGRWYAVALLTGPLIATATLLALSLSSPAFTPAIVTTDEPASLLLSGVGAGLIVAFFEELGWTGFAMPRLLGRRGILATGLIMGLLWGAWHLPVFAGSAATSGAIPSVLFMTAMLFAWLVPYRVLMVWLYDRTQSVLLVMLMHVPIVITAIVLDAASVSGEQRFLSLMVNGAAYWAIVGVVALANHGHLSRREVDRATAHAAV